MSSASRNEDLARTLRDLILYGLFNLAALAVDWTLLIVLTHAGLHYLLASAVGFLAGVCVSYVSSVRFVFADRRSFARNREAAGFLAIGCAGLLLSVILLFAFVDGAGLPPGLAKVPTVGICFLFNFFVRRSLLFTGKPKEAPTALAA
jgi:putative flippase GtrA